MYTQQRIDESKNNNQKTGKRAPVSCNDVQHGQYNPSRSPPSFLQQWQHPFLQTTATTFTGRPILPTTHHTPPVTATMVPPLFPSAAKGGQHAGEEAGRRTTGAEVFCTSVCFDRVILRWLRTTQDEFVPKPMRVVKIVLEDLQFIPQRDHRHLNLGMINENDNTH